MNVGQVIADVLKREGVDILFTYPLNPLTESAAAVDIRPIVVRQERVGCAMADAIGRMTSGDKVGVFCCQHGPGIENAFGAVAQAYSEGVPLVVVAGGTARGQHYMKPYFNSSLNFRHITKHAETDQRRPRCSCRRCAARSASRATAGPGPCWSRCRPTCGTRRCREHRVSRRRGACFRRPTRRPSTRPPRRCSRRSVPLIYAGQGVHYAKAWPELKAASRAARGARHDEPRRQERVSREPPAVAGLGRRRCRAPSRRTWRRPTSCSASARASRRRASASASRRKDKIVHPQHRRRRPTSTKRSRPSTRCSATRSSRSACCIEALNDRLQRPAARPHASRSRRTSKSQKDPWLAEWMPHLTSEAKPLSPYRMIHDLLQVADVPNTIITHDAGSPRDELSPFWKPIAPLELHRLGQEHAARLRPRARDGREGRAPRTSSASTSGATRRSA